MATVLASSNKFIAVSTGSSALICNNESSEVKNIEQPRTLLPVSKETSPSSNEGKNKNPRKGETSLEHEERHMACVAVSSCGEWLALASSRGQKQVGLWRTSDWTMVSARAMARAASCICFTPSSSAIIVADKAGDVYLYSVTDPQKEKEWLLGHIAMLLDILITPNEKYLITCDRDEKIRISCFPNTYNIHGYCLGHDMFVSSLSLLPHKPSVLVSTSGDGSLRLWDYLSGEQLLCLDVPEILKQPQDSPLAVKSCVGIKVNDMSSILCICIGGLSKCIVFRVCEEEEWNASLLQQLSLPGELWSMGRTLENKLITLCNSQEEALSSWNWDQEQSHLKQSQDNLFKKINKEWDILKTCFVNPSVPSILYRRKYADDGYNTVPPERPVKLLKSKT